MIHAIRYLFALLALFASMTVSSVANAEISKETCLESHSRAQDAKEQGKLSLARKLFMTCAQSACPSFEYWHVAGAVDSGIGLQLQRL